MKSTVRESLLRTKIKTFIPMPIQKVLYAIIKKIRFTHSKWKSTLTKNDLKTFLKVTGLKQGDTVMLHSSLGRIGYIEGGANTLLDAFIETVGKKGTLVVPTFSPEHYDKKKKTYYFDVKKTPAYTGSIPETLRKRIGAKRSLSPLHSVAAYGKNASLITKNHEKCDNPYAMNGPFGKLYNLDAKIYLLGVDQLANSSIHIVEDKCKFPQKVWTKKLKAEVKTTNGKKKNITFRRHLKHLYKLRKNNILEKHLLKDNTMTVFPFGNTEVRVMRVKGLVRCMEKLLKKGITVYNQ